MINFFKLGQVPSNLSPYRYYWMNIEQMICFEEITFLQSYHQEHL